ncbi:nuclease-related domain-containing protein [Bacillus sp. ISL-45]|uniref:nuclease-related domain-containing protein n=1 Tax=Bacillus sp. ISL-45 TaxID=2819128 RepID=UPI001BE7D7DB|nr:nuclease-related domain-containing protein [Bacillus sp. ISL-45]
MIFTEKDKQRHYSLRKGYEGEVQYDAWMNGLEIENLTLNDLLLEMSGTTFQVDSSVITQNKLLLFEVKNYEGDYYYEDGRLKIINGEEIKDPLLQLKRSTSLFRQLLSSLGFHLEIESYVLFINPEFTLYQAPKNAPIILPSQLNRFMKKLNKRQSTLNNLHKKVADKLLELHKVDDPYNRVPKYEYEQLKKGIVCWECHAFIEEPIGRSFTCEHCGRKESVESAIMRNTDVFKILFPDKKITTTAIYDWCNHILSKKTIRRVLTKNLMLIRNNKLSYFK